MNRRVLLAGAGAALAILVLWYLLLWSPRGNAIDDAGDRQREAENTLQQLRSELDRLQALRDNEAATRARIEQLRQAIPDEPNLAQFILDANDAANQSGIDFLSIAPTPPAATAAEGTAGAPPAQVALSINITGGYFQVLDFVNRLNRLTRIVVIDGMNVGAGQGGSLSVSLTGRMFVTSVPAGTAAPTPGAAPDAGATTTTTAAPGATTTTAPAGATTTVPGTPPTTAVAQ